MSATQERERAIQVAKTDFPTALQRARAVSEAWYRAQALAWVARFAPDAGVERVAKEALTAASGGSDACQQVAASAWAVRALAERGRCRKAEEATAKLVRLSDEISNPVSRHDALSLLLHAAWPLDRRIRRTVLDKLLAACQAASSWQSGCTWRDVVLMLAPEDAGEARRLLEQLPEGRHKRQAQRRLGTGGTMTPRSFFW
jgi:hypothetical protein